MRRLAVAALLALAAAAARGDETDFEAEARIPSIALGPVQPGSAHLSADLGWVRSGIRGDLGLGGGADLFLRGETFLLADGVRGQHAASAGLRWSPFDGTGLRASLSAELGFLFVPLQFGSRDLIALRFEALAGYPVYGFLPYVRSAIRALRYDTTATSGWAQDGEAGVGVERALGKAILGAEASTWLQPGVPGMFQWRLRAGWAF